MYNMDEWTGILWGKMHNQEVTLKEIAAELGITKAYASMVLNCQRRPPNAEQRFNDAFNNIIERKEKNNRGNI